MFLGLSLASREVTLSFKTGINVPKCLKLAQHMQRMTVFTVAAVMFTLCTESQQVLWEKKKWIEQCDWMFSFR